MKIVYAIPRPMSIIYGGSEVQMSQTRANIQKLGVDVELLDYYSRDQLKKVDGVHIFGSDSSFYQLAQLIKAYGLPLFVSSIYYPVGKTRILQRYYSFMPRTSDQLRAKVLRMADIVLPNSNSEAQLLHLDYKLPLSNIRVVHNGVDNNIRKGDAQSFLTKYPQFAGIRFVLSVGRIEKRKNSINLIKAAKNINAPIVFVGKPVDTETEYVKRFFEEAAGHTAPFLHIAHLNQDNGELADAYAACHTHALVSYLETPGLASLEAGSTGANLLVGACGPVEEYFSGIAEIVDQHDVYDIAHKLQRTLVADRGYYGQEKTIQRRFTWSQSAEDTLKAYREIIK